MGLCSIFSWYFFHKQDSTESIFLMNHFDTNSGLREVISNYCIKQIMTSFARSGIYGDIPVGWGRLSTMQDLLPEYAVDEVDTSLVSAVTWCAILTRKNLISGFGQKNLTNAYLRLADEP